MGFGLRQGCVLIVYLNWIDKCSQAVGCATIGNCKICRVLFTDGLVLLSSTESGLQRAFNSFADARNIAGMKISTVKTKIRHLLRLKLVEKFKYFGVAFTSDGRQDEELDTRTGKASELILALQYSVVMKRELSKKAKLLILKQFLSPSHLWS